MALEGVFMKYGRFDIIELENSLTWAWRGCQYCEYNLNLCLVACDKLKRVVGDVGFVCSGVFIPEGKRIVVSGSSHQILHL